MKGLIHAIVLISALAITSIAHAAKNWEPVLGGDKDFFPSAILATRNLDVQTLLGKPQPPEILGDPMGAFGIKVRTTAPDTKIKVSITLDGLSETSVFDDTLPKANTEYTIMPYIRYKADALWKVRQPYPTTAIFNVSVNDAAAEEVTRKINVHPVNDVPYATKQDGKEHNTQFLFAAFVNENSPVIDAILQDALAHNAVNKFIGYDGDTQEVYRQIFAIWNALQRKGVKYSNIVTPAGFSKTIYSQHVRLPDESFNNSQANCVDGSVLLASALYKIGMCPVLVLKPGHMFMGVHTDKNMCGQKNLQDVAFIETTMVGSVRLIQAQKNWKFLTKDGYLMSTSYRSMQQAMDVGRQTFNSMIPGLQAQQPGYGILDIHQLRSMGIMPITSGAAAEQSTYTPPPPEDDSNDFGNAKPRQIIKGRDSMIIQY